MENSKISENHLKAIVGWLQVIGEVGFRQVPIYRRGNRGAKKKRRKVALEAGSWGWGVLNYMDLRGVSYVGCLVDLGGGSALRSPS